MNYNLMPVKYFVDVVQTHGFISAAKRNYVSETAVSLAIKKLENELGHKLLNRSAGAFSLTPTGKLFYERAVQILNSYSEIWHHPDSHPEKLLRIHFLQGLESEAAKFAQNLPKKYRLSFDEEIFANSISRLLDDNYDLLVGFQLEFADNPKVKVFPIQMVDFDLLFNSNEVEKANANLKQIAKKSKFYIQNWKSSGILNIQTTMLDEYGKNGWTYDQIDEVNSFYAACLNVNFQGGITMVPRNFVIPNSCEKIYRYSPAYLEKSFETVIVVNANREKELGGLITKAITLSYCQ